jgi:hypothetical protein
MKEGFLSGYPAINDIYDEMMSGNVVRNHYRDFVNGFSSLMFLRWMRKMTLRRNFL